MPVEASRGAGALACDVVGSIPTRENTILNIFNYSLWSGSLHSTYNTSRIRWKYGVECLNTSFIAPSAYPAHVLSFTLYSSGIRRETHSVNTLVIFKAYITLMSFLLNQYRVHYDALHWIPPPGTPCVLNRWKLEKWTIVKSSYILCTW